jgi:hypothetical protein
VLTHRVHLLTNTKYQIAIFSKSRKTDWCDWNPEESGKMN